MLTGDTITDEQIRELHKSVKPLGVADMFCRIALGLPLPDKTSYGDPLSWSFNPSDPAERDKARERCADMFNARTSNPSRETKAG